MPRGTPTGHAWQADGVSVTTPTRTVVLDFGDIPSGAVLAMRQLFQDISALATEYLPAEPPATTT
ncbi:hypothetical protein [Micromonospora sp. NPDC047527]|uniref:hypothetical protein n=1 Tax=unclassified Micromonospora TaxID=2617518 RepID=UPI0033DE71E8